MPPQQTVLIRCPHAPCQKHFHAPNEVLGRFVACPGCQRTISARPVEAQAEIERRSLENRCGLGQPAPFPRLPLVGVLDDIRSRWNVGSMFRTADGAGIEQLRLCGITCTPPDPQITKTAFEAERIIPWEYSGDVLAASDKLIQEGYTLVALETSPQALSIHDFAPPAKIALVAGNEVGGVHPEILAKAAYHLAIPMRGHKVSLNVAVAFGIAAYTLAERMRAR